MEMVRVEFEVLPPDNTGSLYDKLMEVAKEFGLADCGEAWSHGGLVMNIPADENSWKFCKRMRRSCIPRIFSSD